MDSPLSPARLRIGPALRAILVGGLACGVFDYVFAYVYYKRATWSGIGRSVARGVLGADLPSFDPSLVVALGVVLHAVISVGAATVFVLASRKFRALTQHPVIAGLAYGIVVYFVMNWVVVPASAIVVAQYPPAVDWGALGGHMVLVGLPIALATHWITRPTTST